MKKYKASKIAKWLIFQLANSGELLTHLKLQKLLYYSEVWNQIINERELFEEKFQAWAHGPVVPEVYSIYKLHSWNVLPVPKSEPKGIDDETINVLNQIINSYGALTAKALENMTHEDQPWIDARGGRSAEERCETVIPKDSLVKFFKSKYNIVNA